MNNPDFDIERFAEKLARVGREAVLWERRKLQWILEEQASQEPHQNREAKQSNAA